MRALESLSILARFALFAVQKVVFLFYYSWGGNKVIIIISIKDNHDTLSLWSRFG